MTKISFEQFIVNVGLAEAEKMNTCHDNLGQFCSTGGSSEGEVNNGMEGKPDKVFLAKGHTLEYWKDVPNRKVVANVNGVREELSVGDYFKKNDNDNFNSTIKQHSDNYAVRNGIILKDTNPEKSPSYMQVIKNSQRRSRGAGPSASEAMGRQRR